MSNWTTHNPFDTPPHLPGVPLILVRIANGSEVIADTRYVVWDKVIAYKFLDDKTSPTDTVADVLAARGLRYGVFKNHAALAQALKDIVFHTKTRKYYKEKDQVEALEMICHKIARIVNGDENYADNWVDIAGYAKLVADRLTKGE